MVSRIWLDARLHEIKTFFDRITKTLDVEFVDIARRSESGAFHHPDDEANGYYNPYTSEQIAIRAVLSELNSLIESQLQTLAVVPHGEQQRAKSASSKLRFVWDEKRSSLCELIETRYDIKLQELPGAEAIEEIRQKINAYKHRGGVMDPRDSFASTGRFPNYFKLERAQTYAYIESATCFLHALEDETLKEPCFSAASDVHGS